MDLFALVVAFGALAFSAHTFFRTERKIREADMRQFLIESGAVGAVRALCCDSLRVGSLVRVSL